MRVAEQVRILCFCRSVHPTWIRRSSRQSTPRLGRASSRSPIVTLGRGRPSDASSRGLRFEVALNFAAASGDQAEAGQSTDGRGDLAYSPARVKRKRRARSPNATGSWPSTASHSTSGQAPLPSPGGSPRPKRRKQGMRSASARSLKRASA